MERLIILSDLWGKEHSEWITNYTEILKSYYSINYYDCCDLGQIDKKKITEENIHQQFINDGIERAVKSLLQKEKEIINILGFSVGGTIAWKAALEGLKVKNLTLISSTRIRYENLKPSGNLQIYFGELDKFKPTTSWFNNLDLKAAIYKKENHDFYTKKEIAVEICNTIIN